MVYALMVSGAYEKGRLRGLVNALRRLGLEVAIINHSVQGLAESAGLLFQSWATVESKAVIDARPRLAVKVARDCGWEPYLVS